MEYDPSGNSNASFYVEANILNSMFICPFLIFPCIANSEIW